MTTRHFQRPNPYWDWRAAGNFVCGGAGSGLAFFASLCGNDAARAPLTLAGLALVGLGLFFVWLEIGRPLRAPNVLLHVRTSWMSREALAAPFLFAFGAASVFGLPGAPYATAAAALVFLYCQANILGAARAIPTWHQPLTVPLLVLTGLTEGMGLFWLLGSWSRPSLVLAAPLGLLVVARWLLWRVWRRRLAPVANPAALRALAHEAPTLEWIGTLAPFAFVVIAVPAATQPTVDAILLAAAGLFAAATGASLKYVLVTRTAYHHGFSLPRMPVRGVPRTAPR